MCNFIIVADIPGGNLRFPLWVHEWFVNNALPVGFCKLCNVCDVTVLLLFFVLSSCTVKPHSTRNLEVGSSSVVTVFSNTLMRQVK